MNPALTRRALLCALAAIGAGARAAEEDTGAVRKPWPAGKPAPALDLASDQGRRWRLSEAAGQLLLINFWASWCQPCVEEMPSLELLAQRLEPKGAQVLAVNYRETDRAIEHYLAQWPITLPILRDGDGAAARACDVHVFPSTVVIGRGGRVAFTVVGGLDWNGPLARSWIAPLL